MRIIICFLSLVQLFHLNPCLAQNSFSTGAVLGFGPTVPTVPTVHSFLETEDTKRPMHKNIFFSGGMLCQYTLADKMGIESGMKISYQSYQGEILSKSIFKNESGANATYGINDYSVPIQVFYKIDHPTNPFKHIKFLAGASMDWHSTEYLRNFKSYKMTSTILAGIRMGNKKGRRGRIEYGIEYQYSLWGRYRLAIDDDYVKGILDTRTSALSLNLYYFFLNRKEKKIEAIE